MNIQRTGYIAAIRARFRDNPIVSLVGPRQAGKTTLARMLAETSTEPAHFFDLESPADLARLSNPELVLRPLTGLVILDEIQRMPDLFPVLRVLADRDPAPARLLIMGSASPALIKEGSESLAGRVSFIDVTGFSLKELNALAHARYVSPAKIAQVHVGLGQRDKALDRLDDAYAERAADLAWVRVRPVFSSLSHERQFIGLSSSGLSVA